MSILLGPADADHFRIAHGRYKDRWYTDPLPGCDIAPASDWEGPSYSIVKKAAGQDWSYVALGRAANDIVNNYPKYDDQRPAIYKRLTHANDHGLKVAAGRGTIIHWWFEDALAGKPFRTVTDLMLMAHKLPPEALVEALHYQDAITAFFDVMQPELVVAEIVCIDRELNGVGYGCTGDAGIRIDGKLYAADWKSRGLDSDHGIYPEEAAQVGGAFVGAQYSIVQGPDGNPMRAPVPAFDGAIVVSVKHDGCRIYPVHLDKAREHYERMHAWWVARQTERKAYGRAWPPRGKKNADPPAEDQQAGEGPANTPPATIEPEASPTTSNTAAASPALDRAVIHHRAKALAGHLERLAQVWPAGVPGLREAHEHTDAELAAILAAIRQVENETNAPWNPDDVPPPSMGDKPGPVGGVARVNLIDEGPDCSDMDYTSLAERVAALPEQKRIGLEQLTAEANRHNFPISLRQKRSVRRLAIGTALVCFAEHDVDTATIRTLVDSALDYDNPNAPLGALLGALTIDQANRLVAMAVELALGDMAATPTNESEHAA
jgi:hypothetical protein